MPNLEIVVLDDEPEEGFEQGGALLRLEAVDLLRVDADGIDGLPARDGVGAHDGVNGREVGADILRGAAGAFEKGEPALGGDGVELRLGEGAGQGLVEFLVGFRDAVVDVVAGCPQGVWDLTNQPIFCKRSKKKEQRKGGRESDGRLKRRDFLTSSCFRERGHSQHGVITGHLFKRDVAVPFLLVRLLLARLEHEMICVRFGLGVPDQGDMVIPGRVLFGIGIIDRMDV